MSSISLYKTGRPTTSNPKRKVWQLRWHGTDGKRYCETIGDCAKMTKRDAADVQRERQGKVDNHLTPINRPKRMTFAEFAQHDRALIADKRYKTLLSHDDAVRRATKAWGTVRADRVTRVHVASLKAHMRGKGYADASIDQTIRTLRAMWNRAKKDNLVTDNPFSGNGVKWDPADSRIFTAEEIDAMIEVAPDDWWRVFLRLIATTGFRKGEALHLRWQDVDLEDATVKVSRHDAGGFTVEGKSYPLLAWLPKAPSSHRTNPLPSGTVDLLRLFKAKAGRSAYVFIPLERLAQLGARMEDGTLRPDFEPVNNVLRGFRVIQRHARALLAARQDVPVAELDWRQGCIHDLRDTYITQMAWKVPPNVLQRLAGHSDIKTTMKFYSHATPSEAETVRAAVSATGLAGQTDAQVTRRSSAGSFLAATGTENAVGDTIRPDCPRSSVG
ncbi:MAG: tyrosine-type recombinase/integrase [Planctomycetota bacterium]